MTEDPNISLFCQFPFSWVLKAYLDDVWEKVYHMKGNIRLSGGSFNPTKMPKIPVLSRRNRGGCVPHSNDPELCCASPLHYISSSDGGIVPLHPWPRTRPHIRLSLNEELSFSAKRPITLFALLSRSAQEANGGSGQILPNLHQERLDAGWQQPGRATLLRQRLSQDGFSSTRSLRL